jgi:hypothetical protein
MADTTFRAGNPDVIDYTPSTGDVNTGQVIILDNLTGINLGVAQVDIANNAKGSLEVKGSIRDAINLNNAANYKTVYWDNSAKKVTTVSTNNAKYGYVVSDGGGGANSTCRVMLDPNRSEGE